MLVRDKGIANALNVMAEATYISVPTTNVSTVQGLELFDVALATVEDKYSRTFYVE
jgi:hypothetical protein